MKITSTSMAIAGFLVSQAALAAEIETLTMHPVPNQAACAAVTAKVNDAPTKVELCVLIGNFTHHQYGVKFNGRIVLQGIDDQTTQGINTSYEQKDVRLQCTPQEIRGNASEEEVRKTMPSYTEEKVKEIVDLMKGSTMSIEAARLCTIDVDHAPVLKALVLFD